MRIRTVQSAIGIIVLIVAAISLAQIRVATALDTNYPASPGVETKAQSSTGCGPDWVEVPSPDQFTGDVLLEGIAATSSNDVWTVGSTDTQAVIEHWDGSEWSVMPSPNVGTNGNSLSGVAALSNDDAWAVGSYTTGNARTLIEHWDGSEWSVVTSPNVGGEPNSLTGVAAISSDDAWAVGTYQRDGEASRTLIEHWDGSAWSVMPSPNVGNENNSLQGITAVSGSDVWAVGAAGNTALVIHWDGSAWGTTATPLGAGDSLRGIDAASSDDVWAVGDSGAYSLVLHWDGSTWTEMPGPDVGWATYFYGVDAKASNDVWAVGYEYVIPPRPGYPFPYIAHWDGSAWTAMRSPIGGADGHLSGVVALPGEVWTVGHGRHKGLILHYEPCPPTATPTPVPPRCPGERFTDVCPGDYFYQHVLDLNDLSIVSGYETVPPCEGPDHIPCFRPYDSTTRGQVAKIIALSAGFSEPVDSQTFEDVPPDSTFYEYIERLSSRSIINGYPCGGTGEPCGAENRPYFRPGFTVSRAQLAKMATLAFDFQDPVSDQTFEDVVPDNHFFPFVENLAGRSIINGYECGGAGEPCVEPGNRPYFRPGNPITRGQVAKIVNLARVYINPTSTPTATLTPNPATTETPILPTVTETAISPTATGTPTLPAATETTTLTPIPTAEH